MTRDAADSVNSRSSSGSTFWNSACSGGAALATAISSVSSKTSASGAGGGGGAGRISSSVVASSRPDRSASISSWLLLTLGAGGGGAGAGGGAGGAGFAAAGGGLLDGGMSLMAGDLSGGLGAGAAAAGLGGGGAGATATGGFSAAGGLASSSAMIRRIDARISSMEGSWTFAGCVISDSTSSTPSHALFYIKLDGIAGSGRIRSGDPSHRPDLSPDQHRANHRAAPPLLWAPHVALMDADCGANRSAASKKAMSWQITIASKAPKMCI